LEFFNHKKEEIIYACENVMVLQVIMRRRFFNKNYNEEPYEEIQNKRKEKKSKKKKKRKKVSYIKF
jgi:hypothetical protein